MSGKILVVDDLATNRIVLKVKLSASHYDVVQAASDHEAIVMARRHRPDLILANARLSNVTPAEFVTAVRREPALANTPIMLLQPTDCQAERLSALRAGVNDILTKPVHDALLLARLRNLLRQQIDTQDDAGQVDPAQTLGFAETHSDFELPGRIIIAAPKRTEAQNLKSWLSRGTRHLFSVTDMDNAMTLSDAEPPADIYLLRITEAEAETGLRLLAQLKAAQRTRSSPVIVLVDAEAIPLAITLLDMGADDVINGLSDRPELTLRLVKQLHRKRSAERHRTALRDRLRAAMIDPLTGAHNRRFAMPFVQRLITANRESGESFAVMVADLDYFKRVNDSHGHAAGDRVLCEATCLLRAHLRESDMLARIGGEEFLLVLPDTPRRRALRIAERLCRGVRETPIILPGSGTSLTVTISIGVTIGRHRPGLPAPTVEGLLNEADRALYLAKAQGRNQASFCARSAA
ncbi:diguanylate cyclase [uncultured Roseovarius sp.]|uniref:diguanylate cyclase n=1 Tax=uncultured Roseovarius sp. TaxID=293344 RepID=UPI002606BD89|nr:diguanylate cyclase [uncultured Roseovarius sp.]